MKIKQASRFGICVTMTYNFVFDDKLPPQMPLPRLVTFTDCDLKSYDDNELME